MVKGALKPNMMQGKYKSTTQRVYTHVVIIIVLATSSWRAHLSTVAVTCTVWRGSKCSLNTLRVRSRQKATYNCSREHVRSHTDRSSISYSRIMKSLEDDIIM